MTARRAPHPRAVATRRIDDGRTRTGHVMEGGSWPRAGIPLERRRTPSSPSTAAPEQGTACAPCTDDTTHLPATCGASGWARLRQVVDPAGQAVAAVLRGEDGIGRSTVLDAVVDMALADGVQVRRGAGAALQQAVPFALVADLFGLGRRAVDPRQASVWRLVTGVHPQLTDDPHAKALAVTEGLTEVLAHGTQDRLTLLAVDDLHWADRPSLLVLDRLLRRASQLGVRLVAATRPTNRQDVQAVVDRAAEVGVGAVELGPLPELDAIAVVGRVLDGRPGPHLTALVRGAAGNPLFLTEMARAAASAGQLRRTGGVVDLPDAAIPSSFRAVVLARLSALPEATFHVLQVASIMAADIDLAVLGALVGAEPLAVLIDLRPAVVAQLVIERDGVLGFRHQVVRLALHDDLPAEVRRALHHQAAATMRSPAAAASRLEPADDALRRRTASSLRGLGVRARGAVGDRPVTGWDSFTDAERRVVDEVAEGLTYREVGERLHISRRTVETHVANALRKLGLRNRSQLATAHARRFASPTL